MIITKPNYQKRIDILNQVIDSGKLSAEDAKIAKNTIAGLLLEKQMAYELDIAFDQYEDILVLNDLKVEYNGKTAQIDHLVLTCYSAYFIESKSVAGSLQVNEYDEWTRWYGKKPVNMESPIMQSKRHAKILFDLLSANEKSFMGKILGFQKRLGSYTAHHYIAVSTRTNITGKGRDKYRDSLKKADQITETILDFHNKHAGGHLNALLNSTDDDKFKTMNDVELLGMAKFLIENNIAEDNPLKAFNLTYQQSAPNAPTQVQEKQAEYNVKQEKDICPECSHQMEIWSKYGYFWKCTACGKTVAIKEFCPKCKKKMKVRKHRNQYFLGCKDCSIEGLYHEVN